MRRSLRIIAGLAVVGIVALLAFIFVPVQATAPVSKLAADWKAEPGHGEYVMYASDCLACHTAEGGKPFAGGRPIASPMGTIWSTNITPDAKTGIGGWTLDQFRASLYDGLRADGTHLYPAMPYENYRKLTEEDVRALYHYFMNEVAPVENRVEETRLAFPFNLRFGMRAWNWLALSGPAGFTPVAAKPEIEQRGQYLVEGPGHCAACHSPRTALMTQDGVSAGEAAFLTGGMVGEWEAAPLRGPASASQLWSVEEMAAYLATGRNAHSAANGEMSLVVKHSLQHLTDRDNIAIAALLKGLDGGDVSLPETFAAKESIARAPAPADAAGEATAAMLTEASPDMPLGARLYLDNCAGCHFVTGKGAPEIFPELAGNTLVTSTETGPFLSVILHGTELPSTRRRPMRLRMQGYAERLSNAEVADLANFVRTAWGNDAPPVSAADVARQRAPAEAH